MALLVKTNNSDTKPENLTSLLVNKTQASEVGTTALNTPVPFLPTL